MSVVVAHVPGMLHDLTYDWVVARAMVDDSTRLVGFFAHEDDAYWRLLTDEWQRPDDLVVVEQDMLPAEGVVEHMLGCRRPWCTSPYKLGTGVWLTDGLGCTKFAGRLKTRHPDLMQRVGEIVDGGQPARTWRRLDTRISRVLHDLGYRPHVHRRSTHLHDYARRP